MSGDPDSGSAGRPTSDGKPAERKPAERKLSDGQAADSSAPAEGEAQRRDPEINQPKRGADRWVVRGVVVLVGLALALLIYQVGASFLPRWWAERVADQVNDTLSAGILWGLFYGFVFTCFPALLVFQVRRKFLHIKGRIAVVVVGLLLAAPNWLTLFVVLGTSESADKGDLILDLEAPGFRGAMLVGAVAGMAIAVALSGMAIWLKHRKRQVTAYKAEAKERDVRDEADRAATARSDKDSDPS